jgi:flagellum-specific peptidoglycan hydrolase FlgJ
MANYDQLIYNTAIENGFTPISAKLIVAQSRIESGDYESNVLAENNNLFGMKFVGQPLATRGTLAPPSERNCNGTCNGDYYSKYNSPLDSAKDVTGRLYKKTINGVTFEDLKNATDANDFANKLQKRGYFGGSADSYASGIKSRLLIINILEYYNKNKPLILILGMALIVGSIIYYNKKIAK